MSAASAKPRRGRRRRPTVAVFGGGIAGLTAAHELAARGFAVTVYERRAWGGKARSTTVRGSATGGRQPLPGEHGWRVFFGFYKHLPDTMRRIPFGSQQNGVYDNLVAGPLFLAAREGRRDLLFPIGQPNAEQLTPERVVDLLAGALLQTDLPPEAIAHFARRMGVFMSSCDARRIGQWENARWSDFIGADRFTEDYRRLLAKPFAQFTQASRTEATSAAFCGHFLELAIYNSLGVGADGPIVRVLDAPTTEAFIDPWLDELHRLGVRARLGHELVGLRMRAGCVAAALVRDRRGVSTVQADHYVCALPVERARKLFNPRMLRADSRLRGAFSLETGWMTGLQFYLREHAPVSEGHVVYIDSPWALESINQAQFWRSDFASTYGDGQVKDCLSVIIADWTTPGVVFGKPAADCTPRELVREVYEQMKRHVNDGGREILRDDLVHRWALDPGMRRRRGRFHNEDPLVLPSTGSRANRPGVSTRIDNLVLAGDYLEGDWEVANMECANQSGRGATNAVLERTGSREAPCMVVDTYRPREWEPLKRLDEERWQRGESNLFDGGD